MEKSIGDFFMPDNGVKFPDAAYYSRRYVGARRVAE